MLTRRAAIGGAVALIASPAIARRRYQGGTVGGGVPSWVLTSGGIAATLDIDFTSDLAWNATPSAVSTLFACSRASSGYYTKVNGTLQSFFADTLRTGTSGALSEAAATNIVKALGSQDFGLWGAIGGAVTGDVAAAPDGTATADLWTASASGVFGSYLNTFSLGSLTGSYTFSTYVKKGNQRYIFLVFYGSSDRAAVFDLDTGTYVGNGGQVTADRHGIDTLAAGYFRVWVSLDGLSAESMTAGVGLSSGNNVTAVSGDTVYLWGAQVEAGTLPTSYAPNKNLMTRTEDYDAGIWLIEAATLTEVAALAPNGQLVASKLVPTTTVHNHEIFTNSVSNAEVGQPYTFSVYAKGAGSRYANMHLTNADVLTDWIAACYDTQSSAIPETATGPTGNVTFIAATNVDAGNGWRRITLTCLTSTVALNALGFNVGNTAAPNFLANDTFGAPTPFAGNDIDGLYFWGAQLEAGIVATPYWKVIDTNGARAADVITFNDLTWFNGASDSFYAEWKVSNINNAKVWAFDATNDKLLDEQTGMSARITGATVGNTAAAGTTVKAAARAALNNFAISMNGGAVATDVSETAPGTLTASRLGCDLAGANHLNNYIRRVAAFNGTLLNNAALQTLST